MLTPMPTFSERAGALHSILNDFTRRSSPVDIGDNVAVASGFLRVRGQNRQPPRRLLVVTRTEVSLHNPYLAAYLGGDTWEAPVLEAARVLPTEAHSAVPYEGQRIPLTDVAMTGLWYRIRATRPTGLSLEGATYFFNRMEDYVLNSPRQT